MTVACPRTPAVASLSVDSVQASAFPDLAGSETLAVMLWHQALRPSRPGAPGDRSRDVEPPLPTILVELLELHALGALGPQREVGSHAVPRWARRKQPPQADIVHVARPARPSRAIVRPLPTILRHCMDALLDRMRAHDVIDHRALSNPSRMLLFRGCRIEDSPDDRIRHRSSVRKFRLVAVS